MAILGGKDQLNHLLQVQDNIFSHNSNRYSNNKCIYPLNKININIIHNNLCLINNHNQIQCMYSHNSTNKCKDRINIKISARFINLNKFKCSQIRCKIRLTLIFSCLQLVLNLIIFKNRKIFHNSNLMGCNQSNNSNIKLHNNNLLLININNFLHNLITNNKTWMYLNNSST